MHSVSQKATDLLTIWRLVDGKPGHENQSLGLVKAIQKKVACQFFDIKVTNAADAILSNLTSSWSHGNGLPSPDLLIGTGHATHLHLLAAKKVYGGKTVVLMKPTLPAPLFDLCLIPEHDQYSGWGSYIETRGVLNDITNHSESRDAHKSLIMIGGVSKHFHWDNHSVVGQIYDLVKQNPSIHYVTTTSRRTPQSFLNALRRIDLLNFEITPFEKTGQGWVANQLAQVSSAWISEDSVSMVYEGLTANVAVGLLNLTAKRKNRVAFGIDNLVGKGFVVRFDSAGNYQEKLRPVIGFSEANRCSDQIINLIFSSEKSKKTKLVLRLG